MDYSKLSKINDSQTVIVDKRAAIADALQRRSVVNKIRDSYYRNKANKQVARIKDSYYKNKSLKLNSDRRTSDSKSDVQSYLNSLKAKFSGIGEDVRTLVLLPQSVNKATLKKDLKEYGYSVVDFDTEYENYNVAIIAPKSIAADSAKPKSFRKFRVQDTYKALRKRIKDELDETETTSEAVDVVVEALEDAPAEQVLAATVEVLGQAIDALQEQVSPTDDETIDEPTE